MENINVDVLRNILLQLDCKEILRITNNDTQTFGNIINDDYLWYLLTNRDYSDWYNIDEDKKDYATWRELYDHYLNVENTSINGGKFSVVIVLNMPGLYTKKMYDTLRKLNEAGWRYEVPYTARYIDIIEAGDISYTDEIVVGLSHKDEKSGYRKILDLLPDHDIDHAKEVADDDGIDINGSEDENDLI
ncbi:Hypothetical protein ORPV_211 [Orpheovirus IHUMI-LCC2]|uniref:F-box domain-containing protein n=1 Tax=Orpheovirus IHUMI-LCC2 TaxID=2023057 RepID=A0A2I2L3J6_9VIRU|nr:Hypothetical protein ORPV_211 [Orpheovirus IHUMI-LCC2]SNW62115.1 Hypothetical protein ORPV_211 [Orpheovirus IHUMI-LCC2]